MHTRSEPIILLALFVATVALVCLAAMPSPESIGKVHGTPPPKVQVAP